jgi:hypothetical protein
MHADSTRGTYLSVCIGVHLWFQILSVANRPGFDILWHVQGSHHSKAPARAQRTLRRGAWQSKQGFNADTGRCTQNTQMGLGRHGPSRRVQQNRCQRGHVNAVARVNPRVPRTSACICVKTLLALPPAPRCCGATPELPPHDNPCTCAQAPDHAEPTCRAGSKPHAPVRRPHAASHPTRHCLSLSET